MAKANEVKEKPRRVKSELMRGLGCIERPLLRYHGGKYLLAKWILSYFPEHRIYVEPYGGAASVLLKKRRCYAEIYNDLDDEIVNLFCVVRERGSDLREALEQTPFSRVEFELSCENTDDEFERARRTVVRSFMGFGSAASSGRKTGFRANSNRSGTTPAHDWANYPEALDGIIERLQGVVIENRDAIEVMKAQDSPDTLHYLDPPYVLGTRYKGENTKCYNYEMTDEEHVEMCRFIKGLEGVVVLSGYDNELYNDLLSDWQKHHRKAYADGAEERVETLWINRENTKKQRSLFNAT